MNVKAVVDRLEGESAVLLVGEDEKHIVVPRHSIPGAAKEGTWLQVELRGETLLRAEIDEKETAKAKERIAAKMARLRSGQHLKH
jgi:hypothetical protein